MNMPSQKRELHYEETNSMKLWYYTLLACLLLSGCSFNASATPAATISPVPTVKVEQQIQALWAQLDQGSAPANKPSLTWRPAYSVLFPNEWPPTPSTTWVRYAYAQGLDLELHDAVRVSAPWAKLELRGNSDTVTIVPLTPKLEPVTTQGVQPIDEATQAALAQEAAVSTYCRQLTALPQPNSPQSTDMRAFYRTWLKYNGALVDLIRSNHAGFLAWVNE
jgi:hypothetical protein